MSKDPRFTNFAVILYPESEQHRRLLTFFERRSSLYRPVYILHDLDVWVEGDELPEGVQVGERKKPHWHVLISYPTQTVPSAVSKFLGGIYVEGVSNSFHYIQYMVHDTPESWCKTQYDVSSLQGDLKKIKTVFGKHAYFVQLTEIADDIEVGTSLCDIVRHASRDEATLQIFEETYKKFGGLITAMANQYDRRVDRRIRALQERLPAAEIATTQMRREALVKELARIEDTKEER